MDNERLDNLLDELEKTAQDFNNYKLIYESLDELSKRTNKQLDNIDLIKSNLKKNHSENMADLKELMSKMLDISNNTQKELSNYKSLFKEQESSINTYIEQCNNKFKNFILANSIALVLNILLIIFMFNKVLH